MNKRSLRDEKRQCQSEIRTVKALPILINKPKIKVVNGIFGQVTVGPRIAKLLKYPMDVDNFFENFLIVNYVDDKITFTISFLVL